MNFSTANKLLKVLRNTFQELILMRAQNFDKTNFQKLKKNTFGT